MVDLEGPDRLTRWSELLACHVSCHQHRAFRIRGFQYASSGMQMVIMQAKVHVLVSMMTAKATRLA